MYFMGAAGKNPNDALAGATDFLHMMGHVCFGLIWARMAVAARAARVAGAADRAFYEAKLATARYYAARHLPATGMHLQRIQTGAAPVMALEPAEF